MFCPECGKENKDTAKFCTGCGISVETDIETQPISKDTKKIVMACVIGLGVVVAIVGLLVWPKMMHLSDASREGATKGSLEALRSALSTYYGKYRNYPDSLTDLVNDDFIIGIPYATLRRDVPNNNSNKVHYGSWSNDQGGWLYNPGTGRIKVNSTYKDTRGTRYCEY